MKKKALAISLSALMATGLIGCGSNSGSSEGQLKVGMVTDAGTIDDKSFNQGTWEGILKAKDELGIDNNYLKPAGTTEADYMKEIGNLYDTGYKFIVAPGFKFETALFNAQDKYSDAKFVIIDGSPNNGKSGDERVEKVGDNTVAVFFAEQEAGFMAGVAASLELKEGSLGFIGGMEIPSVQKFNWGFQQGVNYANENLGTKMVLKAENVVYQGTFDNVAAGQQLAATMFDSGVNAIFTAAGGVGVGAINEAKARAAAGQKAWIIGVDTDQYEDGKYDGDNSIILTSAMKKIDIATYDIIKDELDGNFPGGKTLVFDIKNDGVGLPKENPNLSAETTAKVDEVYNKVKNGEISILAEQGNLIK
ncbi:MAG: BMP family ABC transporter substrate-binding protein [Clostridium sp.]|uniref:BMP family lipoprotein n=1 Tax=Clostridium sp. TaxID=1506 RepID=UPI0025BBA925|nr:BMP family ABC transporter substrate-binding protein [Clostridium sp.]MCF0149158.1 BMP family ABC transporter substrate-binding protein [Clostridium sp.]